MRSKIIFLLLLGILTFPFHLQAAPPPEQPVVATVIQPNGGEVLVEKESYDIKWTTSATGGTIFLEFSLDGGNNWVHIATLPNPLTQLGEVVSYSWVVPPVETNQGLIRLTWAPAYGPSSTDRSDGFFSIVKKVVTFPDVPSSYWAAQEIEKMANARVVEGYPDGTFKPDNSVTRAEFAKMVVLTLGYSPFFAENPTFPDVPKNHWAYGFVESAVKYGLMVGYPDGSFQPQGKVTKAEVVTVIVRAKAWPLYSPEIPTFADCPLNEWFFPFVETAFSQGIIPLGEVFLVRKDAQGRYYFDPNDPATRAQTAYFLSKILSITPLPPLPSPMP